MSRYAGYTHRNFGWIPETGIGDTTNVTGITFEDSTSTISWEEGTTNLTNTSLTTTDITVVNISGVNDEPVVFPDGVKAQPLYYDDAYELTPGHKNVHHNEVQFQELVTCNSDIRVDIIYPNVFPEVLINSDCVIGATLSIDTVNEDVSNSPFLVRDSTTGEVYYRTFESVIGTTENIEVSSTVDILDDADTVLDTVALTFVKDAAEQKVILNIDAFSATLADTTSKLRIVAGEHICTSRAWFPIMLHFSSAFEECLAAHVYNAGTPADSEIIIVRKNGTVFPVGALSHAIENFGGIGVPLVTQTAFLNT